MHIHDFHATILHLLGFTHQELTFCHSGRDDRLTDVYGNVVKQIIAWRAASVIDTSAYSAPIRELLREPRLPELGPGTPNRSARAALAALSPESIFPALADRSMAMACISGLWLLHDFLDESHTISQDIDTPAGSYWHGIMHRREPDASNAKYWFRRVGHHPVFDLLSAETGQHWDSFAFIDRCEACRGSANEEEMACRRLQQREWELLFDWCHVRATR